MINQIRQYLGIDADYLLNFSEPKIKKDLLYLPGKDFVDKIFIDS